MNRKSNVKINFIYQAFYELLIIFSPLLTAPYLSRVLGVTNIGIYSYTYSVAYYFALFSALGIKSYGIREIAKVRDNQENLNKTFSGLAYLHFIAATIVIGVYYFYALFLVSEDIKFYSLIMGIYVIAAFFDISWLFFGLEQFKVTVTRNTVIKVISILLVFVLVKSKSDLWLYIVIFVFTNTLSQIYLWGYLRGTVSFCKVSFNEIKRHLPQMLILFIPTIAISLYNYMDKIMVGILSTKDQLGFYENSEKIIFVASQFVGAVGTVMMPKMSNIIEKKDNKKIRQYIDASMRIVMCMACAFTGGIVGIAMVFAPVFWGESFNSCSILMVALAMALPFKGFANVLRTQYLIPCGFDKAYTISVCAGAAINLIANIVLIQRFQAMGAVYGTIMAEALVCIIQAVYCRKALPVKRYIVYAIPYLVFAAVMSICVYEIGYVMGRGVWTIFIQVIAGVFIYFIFSIFYFRHSNNNDLLEIIDSFLKRIPVLKKLKLSK